ncbi:unnamed protein product [Malus baccata var. baccata]
MDEDEFRRILDLFPIVRSRDYHRTLPQPTCFTHKAPTKENSKNLAKKALVYLTQYVELKESLFIDIPDKLQICEFWGKLKLVAERKVGAAEAERFCKAFQRIHKRLVCEGLSLDAAQKFLNLS